MNANYRKKLQICKYFCGTFCTVMVYLQLAKFGNDAPNEYCGASQTFMPLVACAGQVYITQRSYIYPDSSI